MVQVKQTPPTNGDTNIIPIMKETISLSVLEAKASEHGMRASLKPFEQFFVATAELKPLLKSKALQKLASGVEVYAFQLNSGHTIKYERQLHDVLVDSEVVEISFYKTEIDGKEVKWIRITSCE